ncbi:MAG TPA: site-2 protease family protein, partial [Clostridia bacterium]|nr:site-2 protease family protein [Clostridia bacterium]
MKKLRIHPAFIILCIVLVCFSKFEILAISLLCVLLHESAHAICAKFFGYRLNVLTLMPYGAVISGEENLNSNDAFFIAIIGPISNLLLATITVAVWWIFPETYSFTLTFFRVNISLAFFNILPFYPLDGGRLCLSFAKNKLIALKRLRFAGIIGSIIFMGLFIVSAFFKINFTFGIISITLFLGASTGTEKQKYIETCNFLSDFKDYRRPIERCEMLVNCNMTLHKLVMSLSSKKIYTLQVVDNCLNTLCIIENEELDKLIAYPNKRECIKNILNI